MIDIYEERITGFTSGLDGERWDIKYLRDLWISPGFWLMKQSEH